MKSNKIITYSDKKYRLKENKVKKIIGGKCMEAVAIKRSSSFTEEFKSKDESFKEMMKCGKKIRKMLELSEQDIYKLLKR